MHTDLDVDQIIIPQEPNLKLDVHLYHWYVKPTFHRNTQMFLKSACASLGAKGECRGLANSIGAC